MSDLRVRELIERFEEIEKVDADDPDAPERDALRDLLFDLSGSGGAEEWRGDWYPSILIYDFEDEAQQLAEELSSMSLNEWPYRHIDWAAAAEELQQDYSSVEYQGTTYWFPP